LPAHHARNLPAFASKAADDSFENRPKIPKILGFSFRTTDLFSMDRRAVGDKFMKIHDFPRLFTQKGVFYRLFAPL